VTAIAIVPEANVSFCIEALQNILSFIITKDRISELKIKHL
jgi:hypothetical protein